MDQNTICYNVTCFNFVNPRGVYDVVRADNLFFLVESQLPPNEMFLSDNSVIWATSYKPYRVLNQIMGNNEEFFSSIDLKITNFVICLGQV